MPKSIVIGIAIHFKSIVDNRASSEQLTVHSLAVHLRDRHADLVCQVTQHSVTLC